MIVFLLALLFAACIGWTLHTRVLRRALHESRAEIDARAAKGADELITDLEAQPEAARSEIARVTTEHACWCAELGAGRLDGTPEAELAKAILERDDALAALLRQGQPMKSSDEMNPPLLPLEPHDIASWAAFLPTVRVGGALPVAFRLDGSHVVAETLVPYMQPVETKMTVPFGAPRADPSKIPLTLPEGFPVPLTARYQLPAFSPDIAAHFLRQIAGLSYQHELDEQLRVGDLRPFNPGH
jgi:hypothetical protein